MTLTVQPNCRVGVIITKVVALLQASVSGKGAMVVHIDVTLQEEVLQIEGIGCGALLVGERAAQSLA